MAFSEAVVAEAAGLPSGDEDGRLWDELRKALSAAADYLVRAQLPNGACRTA